MPAKVSQSLKNFRNCQPPRIDCEHRNLKIFWGRQKFLLLEERLAQNADGERTQRAIAC